MGIRRDDDPCAQIAGHPVMNVAKVEADRMGIELKQATAFGRGPGDALEIDLVGPPLADQALSHRLVNGPAPPPPGDALAEETKAVRWISRIDIC
jgi:hypothetical protein